MKVVAEPAMIPSVPWLQCLLGKGFHFSSLRYPWSLFGTGWILIINEKKNPGLTLPNEGGMGKISFLKNIIGLWLIQESQGGVDAMKEKFSFGNWKSWRHRRTRSLIDPDALEFAFRKCAAQNQGNSVNVPASRYRNRRQASWCAASMKACAGNTVWRWKRSKSVRKKNIR